MKTRFTLLIPLLLAFSCASNPASTGIDSQGGSIAQGKEESHLLTIEKEGGEFSEPFTHNYFEQEGDDLYVYPSYGYPLDGALEPTRVKAENVRLELACRVDIRGFYFGIPDQKEEEWTLETLLNYQIQVKASFHYTLPSPFSLGEDSEHDAFFFLGNGDYAVSVKGDGLTLDCKFVASSQEGLAQIEVECYGCKLTKGVSVRAEVYDRESFHTLTAIDREGKLVSLSPMESRFEDGDEYTMDLGIVDDAPNAQAYFNGAPYYASPISSTSSSSKGTGEASPSARKLDMPPFDCVLEVV